MKKFKNLAFSFMMVALMFVGAGVVEAKSYTAYTRGQEITVNLNDSITGQFYVINDSDSSSETVTALLKDFVDDNTYTYVEAQALATTTAGNWSNTVSVKIPGLKELLGYDIELENSDSYQNLTEPTWISPNTTSFTEYWLSDVPFNGHQSVVWGMDTYYNSQFKVSVRDASEKAYVRFVINVYKDYVVGGVTETEEEKYWEGFVEKFKDSSNPIFGTYDSSKVVINHTNDSLTVTTDVEGVSYTTKFTYANGILTYVPTTDPSNAFIDTMWVGNAYVSLVKFKNYDGGRVSAWMEKNTTPTLAKDGLSYTEYENVITGSAPGVDASITTNAYSSFEMDIVNGIKTLNDVVEDNNNTTEEPKEEVTENPDTGVFEQYGLAIAIILGVGVLGYISTRKHSRFPQA